MAVVLGDDHLRLCREMTRIPAETDLNSAGIRFLYFYFGISPYVETCGSARYTPESRTPVPPPTCASILPLLSNLTLPQKTA